MARRRKETSKVDITEQVNIMMLALPIIIGVVIKVMEQQGNSSSPDAELLRDTAQTIIDLDTAGEPPVMDAEPVVDTPPETTTESRPEQSGY